MKRGKEFIGIGVTPEGSPLKGHFIYFKTASGKKIKFWVRDSPKETEEAAELIIKNKIFKEGKRQGRKEMFKWLKEEHNGQIDAMKGAVAEETIGFVKLVFKDIMIDAKDEVTE